MMKNSCVKTLTLFVAVLIGSCFLTSTCQASFFHHHHFHIHIHPYTPIPKTHIIPKYNKPNMKTLKDQLDHTPVGQQAAIVKKMWQSWEDHAGGKVGIKHDLKNKMAEVIEEFTVDKYINADQIIQDCYRKCLLKGADVNYNCCKKTGRGNISTTTCDEQSCGTIVDASIAARIRNYAACVYNHCTGNEMDAYRCASIAMAFAP